MSGCRSVAGRLRRTCAVLFYWYLLYFFSQVLVRCYKKISWDISWECSQSNHFDDYKFLKLPFVLTDIDTITYLYLCLIIASDWFWYFANASHESRQQSHIISGSRVMQRWVLNFRCLEAVHSFIKREDYRNCWLCCVVYDNCAQWSDAATRTFRIRLLW